MIIPDDQLIGPDRDTLDAWRSLFGAHRVVAPFPVTFTSAAHCYTGRSVRMESIQVTATHHTGGLPYRVEHIVSVHTIYQAEFDLVGLTVQRCVHTLAKYVADQAISNGRNQQ